MAASKIPEGWEVVPTKSEIPEGWEVVPQAPQETPAPQEPQPQEDSWANKLTRIVDDLGGRASDIGGTMGDLDLPFTDKSLGEAVGFDPSGRRQLSIPEAAAQNVGAAIGTAGDVAYAGVEAAIPDGLGVEDKFNSAVSAVSKTKGGAKAFDMLKKGVLKWDDYAKAYPQNAKTLMAVGNIATMIPGIKGLQAPVKHGVVRGLGDKVVRKVGEDVGEQAQNSIEKSIATKLIGPDGVVDVTGRGKTIEGPLGQLSYDATGYEKTVAKVLSDVPGVKPERSLRSNVAALDKEIGKVETRLANKLKNAENPGNMRASVSSKLDDIIATEANPKAYRAIGEGSEGLGAKAGLIEDMVLRSKAIMSDFPDTPVGINDARKKIDKEFSANTALGDDGSKGAVLRYIRNTLNDEVDLTDPSIRTLRSDTLSPILSGRETVAKKAVAKQEGITASVNDAMRKYHLPFTLTAAIASLMNPVTGVLIGGAATGVIASQAAKKIGGKQARKQIAEAISGIDKALKEPGINSSKLADLTATRASLVGVLKESGTGDEE